MQTIQLQSALEGIDGLRKLLGLHVGCAQEIPGIGVVRINFADVLKSVNRCLHVARVLSQHAQSVPGIRIVRVLLEGVFERGFGLVNFLQVQISDALVQPRNRKLRIESRGLLKSFKAFLEKLLIHVRASQIVEACGLGRIRLGGGKEQAKSGQERCEKSG